MALIFHVCNSIGDFQEYIEQSIGDAKSALGLQLRLTSDARKAYEQIKKASAEGKIGSKQSKQLSESGLRMLINPTKEQELVLMEKTFSTLQDKLSAYERAKELYPILRGRYGRIGIVLDDGLPTAFLLYAKDEHAENNT